MAEQDQCLVPPIDKTCPSEVLGIPCGDEPVLPHPSLIPPVCKNVKSVRTSSPASFSLKKFRSGREWDLKKQPGGNERLGNVNYGAVMRAAGFPREHILRLAGAYQWLQGLTSVGSIYGKSSPLWGAPWGRSPFGDDPRDQHQIDQGIYLVDSGICK
jgi:hypothetical protein